MKKIFRARSTLALSSLLLVAAVLLSGCGQTGPLYLPEDAQKKTLQNKG